MPAGSRCNLVNAEHRDITCSLQAEKSLIPTQSQSTPPSTSNASSLPDTQPKPKRPTAELMEELRKAQASGKSMVLPVDADGSNIEDIMKEIAGNVLQEAIPDLMQHMGVMAAERNPIMQASSGVVSTYSTCLQLVSCLQ